MNSIREKAKKEIYDKIRNEEISKKQSEIEEERTKSIETESTIRRIPIIRNY